MSITPQNFRSVGAGIVIFGVLAFVHLQLRYYCADDAYIHFRIAQRFVETGYPYYNSGEAVMATSSTVWTLILTAIFFVSGSSIAAVSVVNAAVLLLTAITWGQLAERMGGEYQPRLKLAAQLITLATLLGPSLQLMETPLAFLLLGLGLLRLQQDHRGATIFLTIAAFTRLEMGVFLLLVTIPRLCSRTSALRALWEFMCVFVPLAAFDLSYYSTLVPHTMRAKEIIYHLTMSEFSTLALSGLLSKFLFYNFPGFVTGYLAVVVLLAAYQLISNVGSIPRHIFRGRAGVLGIGGILILSAYAVKRVYIFPWYVPLYTLPLFISALSAGRRQRTLTNLALTTILFLPIVFSASRDLWAGVFNSAMYSEYEQGLRAQEHRIAALELYHQCDQCTILSAEIGGVGYGFSGKVIDAAGLASPEALTYERHDRGLGGEVPVELVRATHPDFIVSMEGLLESFQNSEEAKNYSWETRDFHDSRGERLLVLRRHPA